MSGTYKRHLLSTRRIANLFCNLELEASPDESRLRVSGAAHNFHTITAHYTRHRAKRMQRCSVRSSTENANSGTQDSGLREESERARQPEHENPKIVIVWIWNSDRKGSMQQRKRQRSWGGCDLGLRVRSRRKRRKRWRRRDSWFRIET